MWSVFHSNSSEWTGKEDGFSFYSADWTIAMKLPAEHFVDALAHYDEAIRRQAICRLEGKVGEAGAWKNIAVALNNEFGLKRGEHGNCQESAGGS